jgi:hypothetical protein
MENAARAENLLKFNLCNDNIFDKLIFITSHQLFSKLNIYEINLILLSCINVMFENFKWIFSQNLRIISAFIELRRNEHESVQNYYLSNVIYEWWTVSYYYLMWSSMGPNHRLRHQY